MEPDNTSANDVGIDDIFTNDNYSNDLRSHDNNSVKRDGSVSQDDTTVTSNRPFGEPRPANIQRNTDGAAPNKFSNATNAFNTRQQAPITGNARPLQKPAPRTPSVASASGTRMSHQQTARRQSVSQDAEPAPSAVRQVAAPVQQEPQDDVELPRAFKPRAAPTLRAKKRAKRTPSAIQLDVPDPAEFGKAVVADIKVVSNWWNGIAGLRDNFGQFIILLLAIIVYILLIVFSGYMAANTQTALSQWNIGLVSIFGFIVVVYISVYRLFHIHVSTHIIDEFTVEMDAESDDD